MDPRTEEFNALVEASGWSQAEVARQLKITPGAVSQLCSGKTFPRASTLSLFRLILAKKKPAALSAYENARAIFLDPWIRDIIKALSCLAEKDRQRFLKPLKELVKAYQSANLRHRG